jgi:TRAP-type C4-dicarboxylate transport system substrate-binding protein
MIRYLQALAVAVSFNAFLLLPAAAEQTIKLTLAASHSPNLPFVGQMSTFFKPEVEKRLAAAGSDIKINWTEAYSGSLYTFQYTLEAVEDNLTDIGWVGTIWESSKMPLQQITFVTPFVVDDVRVVIDVMNDLHQELPALRQEWDARNQVYLGATGIGTYHIYTTFPFETLASLKGNKINGAGLVGSWLKGTGAIPVDGGIPIFYENVKNRIVDGVLLTAQTAYSIKLHEVAPNVTQIGIGAQYVGGLSVNKQVWESFPPELQKIMREVGLEYSKRVGEQTVASDDAALGKMANEKANVTTLASSERDLWIRTLPNLPDEWIKGADKVGRGEAAREMLKTYLVEMDKRGQKAVRDWSN